MVNDLKALSPQPFQIGVDDGEARQKSKPRKMQREDSMKPNKVMVEVGNLEKLKKAIAAFESGHTVFEDDETTLVELAKRVVAEEEKIRKYIEFPVDIDSY